MNGQLQLEIYSNDLNLERRVELRPTARSGGRAAPPPARRPRSQIPATRLRWLLVLSDASAITIGIALATTVRPFAGPIPTDVLIDHLQLAAATLPIWLVAMAANRLFTARTLVRRLDEFRRLVIVGGLGSGSIIALAFAIQFQQLSRMWVALVFLCVTITLAISRTVARRTFAWLRRAGYSTRPVVIVGAGVDAHAMLRATRRHPELGYHVIGLIGDEDFVDPDDTPVLGTTNNAMEAIERSEAIGAILSVPSLDPKVVNVLTRQLTRAGYHVTLSSALCDIDVTRARPQEIGGQMLIYVEPVGTSACSRIGKRTFDVVLAALLLLLSAPLLLVAAIAVRVESSGPALFRQRRVGHQGAIFEMLKLRTMVADAEERRRELIASSGADARLFKMTNDPRITRVGKVLRKTSIDELPQLWNVLRGEMSIVGPRPALPDELAQWSSDLYERLRVLPGITGMWQVSGRSDLDFEQYKRLDLYYVDNWSLLRDLVIVARTARVVLLGRGAC